MHPVEVAYHATIATLFVGVDSVAMWIDGHHAVLQLHIPRLIRRLERGRMRL
jgi:hypothetical protein